MLEMVGEDIVSDPVDPLAGCSTFSLFPLSFSPTRRSTIDKLNPNSGLHSRLKAMVLRSPDKLLEQAKTIIDDVMDPNKTSALGYDDKTEKVSYKNDKSPHKKRPALGFKRAKFSAKPMPSEIDVPKPSIDIGKLEDPVDFFAAFERMENAVKELQKLRGRPLANLDQNRSPLSPRRRRPSLFEKSATYKHHSYSSTTVCDNGETFPLSQKTLEKPITSPTLQNALPEADTYSNSKHDRVLYSTAATTSELNELDELLSGDYEGLDEARVVDILQDKLQIRMKNLGKPALPDMLDVQRQESDSSCDALPNMMDAISRLNGIRKATCSKRLSLSSQLKESSVLSQASPMKPQSPLASMSLLSRHISKVTASNDPLSALDIDLSPDKILSETVRGKESDQFGTRKGLDKSQTSFEHGEENPAISNPPPAFEENTTSQRIEPEEQVDRIGRSDQDGVGKALHEQLPSTANGEKTATGASVLSPSFKAKNMPPNSEPKEWMDRATGSTHVVAREDFCDFRSSPVHEDQSVANFGEDPLLSAATGINPRIENEEQQEEVNEAMDYVQQELNILGSTIQKQTVNEDNDCIATEALNAEGSDIQEPIEEATEPSTRTLEIMRSKVASKRHASKELAKNGRKTNTQSDVPVSERAENKKRKTEGNLQLRKQERLNHRSSLDGAGTKWEDGLRRSTRIRMRPLDYWRGERFLYGRVHDSMVTVIGVKYSSPSKVYEQLPVKVKSFVSDEYKEMVDLAALH